MKIEDLLCGIIAGWSQIIVGQPFDYVKVVAQAQREKIKKGLLDIAKNIKQQHGWKGFYRGSSSLFFGYALTVGIQFTFYQAAKRFIHGYRNKDKVDKRPYNDGHQLSIFDIGIAGALSGFLISFIISPVQYVKIQKQMHKEVGKGSFALIFDEIKSNGLRTISKGFYATLGRQVIGVSSYFSVYEYSLRKLTQSKRQSANIVNYFISGGLAGLSYWFLTYPIDVVKTKVQNGQDYKTAIKQLRNSSYRGFSVVFIRSILVNAASFVAYQHSKKEFYKIFNKRQLIY